MCLRFCAATVHITTSIKCSWARWAYTYTASSTASEVGTKMTPYILAYTVLDGDLALVIQFSAAARNLLHTFPYLHRVFVNVLCAVSVCAVCIVLCSLMSNTRCYMLHNSVIIIIPNMKQLTSLDESVGKSRKRAKKLCNIIVVIEALHHKWWFLVKC